MWTSIAYVSGGVTLAAFCAAIAAWTFRRKLLGDAKKVRSGPKSERARLVMARQGVIFDTDTAQVLSPNQLAIIDGQIEAAASRFRTTAFVGLGLAILAATVSTFAVFKDSQSRELHSRLDEKLNQIDVVRGKLANVQSKVRIRLILVPEASSWAQTAAQYAPSPVVKNVADTLEELLRSYEEEFGLVEISDRDRLRLRLAKASVANATGNFREGLALLFEEDEQGGLDVLEMRANSFLALRRWSQALVRFEMVTNVRSEKLELVERQAICLMHLRRYADAASKLDAVVEYCTQQADTSSMIPLLSSALVNSGVVQWLQGNLDKAIEDCDKAIELLAPMVEKEWRLDLASGLAAAYNNRGVALRDRRDLHRAVADFETAVQLYTRLVEEGRVDLENLKADSHINRGIALDSTEDVDKAIAIYTRLLQKAWRPQLARRLGDAHYVRGNLLRLQRKLGEAIEEYDKSIDVNAHVLQQSRADSESLQRRETEGGHGGLKPVDTIGLELVRCLGDGYYARAVARQRREQFDEAVADYDNAVKYYRLLAQEEPSVELPLSLPNSEYNRGIILSKNGKLQQATEHFSEAIEGYRQLYSKEGNTNLAGRLATAYETRALSHLRQGKRGKAVEDYQGAIDVYKRLLQDEWTVDQASNLARVRSARGVAFFQDKKPDKAVNEFGHALQIYDKLRDVDGKSDIANREASTHNNRGMALLSQGKVQEAIMDFESARVIHNRLVEVEGQRQYLGALVESLNRLAFFHATHPDKRYRNGTLAVQYATKGCKLTNWTDWSCLATLAAAYAEAGEFDKAKTYQERAIQIAPEDQKEELRSRLKLYKSEKPYWQKVRLLIGAEKVSTLGRHRRGKCDRCIPSVTWGLFQPLTAL